MAVPLASEGQAAGTEQACSLNPSSPVVQWSFRISSVFRLSYQAMEPGIRVSALKRVRSRSSSP